MGIIRSVPQRTFNIKSQKLKDFNYVEASVCGWQHYMEDYTRFDKINDKISVFYVVDGHGGPDIAEIACQLIPIILKESQHIERQEYKSAIQKMFQRLDESLRKEVHRASQIRQKCGMPQLFDKEPVSGCSIAIALVGENEIILANVGQCKSYVSYYANQSKLVLLSGNHTEENKEDQSRIRNAGGYFLNGKLNGMIPFTRSIGDYHFKNDKSLKSHQQLLVSTPSIFSLRKGDIKLIIMGSSGIWQRTNFVLKEIAQDDLQLRQLEQRSKNMLNALICKNPQESDVGLKNMSLIVIDLKNR